MEQRDYLLRQCEQLGQFLEQLLLKLIRIRDYNEIIETVNQSFKQKFDLDIKELIEIEENNLVDTLINKKQIDVGNLEKLADILFFVAENINSDERNLLLTRSLIIYKYLEKTESIYSYNRNLKINKIIQVKN